MLAVMPMYDWPEVQAETDALWGKMRDALRVEGIEAPDALDRQVGYSESWTRPDLVLGQACGLPYIKELSEKVALIGAIDFGLTGCKPGEYNSHIIVNASSHLTVDDLKSRPFAYNTACSQSGLACLHKMGLADGQGIETGGHRASIQLVAEGRADFAAIDANTWRMALEHEPAALELRVLQQTTPTPAPVLIAHDRANVSTYRRALKDYIVKREREEYLSLL